MRKAVAIVEHASEAIEDPLAVIMPWQVGVNALGSPPLSRFIQATMALFVVIQTRRYGR